MYYSKLSTADKGTDPALEEWCQYVLSGFQKQFTKVRSITDFETLKKDILLPALVHSMEKSILSPLQFKILKKCLEKPKAILMLKDVKEIFPELNGAQSKYRLRKMLDEKFLVPTPDTQRSYTINFSESVLLRSMLYILFKQGYAPGLENV
jgi:Fic family protein